MYRTFLSWRWLVTRRINWIGVGGLFLAVGALVLILAIMTGFLETSRAMVRGNLSDIVVEPWNIRQASELGSQPHPEPLVARLETLDGVAHAAPRLVWPGLVSQGRERDVVVWSRPEAQKDVAVEILGVDASRESEVSNFGEALHREPGPAGRPVADPDDPFRRPGASGPDAPRDAIVVGEQMFERLELEVGDTLRLLTWVPELGRDQPRFETLEFPVAGTFRTGANDIDAARVYVDRRDLAARLGRERTYSQVGVGVVPGRDLRDVRSTIVAELERERVVVPFPEEVRTWMDQRPTLLGSIENQRSIMAILLALVLLVAAFTVFAILSMMVREKVRDVGVLGALGASPRGLLGMFLMLGVYDAALGGLAGAAGGAWCASNINAIEAWISNLLGVQVFDHSEYLFDHIPARVDPGSVAIIVGSTFLAVLLATAGPAIHAARIEPVRALRHD